MYPIYLYQGCILDGWNRQKACEELGIEPEYKVFEGATDIEAIEFVMRTNKRRNLSSSQWAAVAVKAEDLVASIRAEIEKFRKEMISQGMIGNSNVSEGKQTRQLIVSSDLETYEPDLFTSPNKTRFSGKKEKKKEKKPPTKTDRTLAGMFNTNPTYINDASRLQRENPAVFEQILSGDKSPVAYGRLP